jgi:hypothetical protein
VTLPCRSILLHQLAAILVWLSHLRKGRKLIFFAHSCVKHSPETGSEHHTHPSFLLHSSRVVAEYKHSVSVVGEEVSESVTMAYLFCRSLVRLLWLWRLLLLGSLYDIISSLLPRQDEDETIATKQTRLFNRSMIIHASRTTYGLIWYRTLTTTNPTKGEGGHLI